MIAQPRRNLTTAIFICLWVFFLHPDQHSFAQSPVQRLPKEMVRISLPKLLEFGANKCIPCKKMMPILQELTEEYKGRVLIKIIDVYQAPELTQANGIQRIPTQIFFDAKNREVFRNIGLMRKEEIERVFEKMGVLPVKK